MENNMKAEMDAFMRYFDGMPGRLQKYMELLLLGKEASPYAYQDTMSLRRLAIALTTYCNLNCIWCFRHDSHYKAILNKHMDRTVLRIILKNISGPLRLIHFGGTGEPLLYPHLLEAIRLARVKTSAVKITTNGVLLTDKFIRDLVKAGLTHIEVSIDAFSSDELLRVRGSRLEKLVALMEYMSAHTGLVMQVNSVVTSFNYKGLFKVVEVLKNVRRELCVHTIPLFIAEHIDGSRIRRITDADYRRLLEKIESGICARGLPWRTSPASVSAGLDPVIEMKRRDGICFTCFEDPYINTDGYLCACGRREFHGIVDASVGFEKVMNAPEVLRYRAAMLSGRSPEYCRKVCFLGSEFHSTGGTRSPV